MEEHISKFDSTLERFEDSSIWAFHFMVPLDIAQLYITPKDRRVICEVNEQFSQHCALMPDGNGEFFIMINKATRTKHQLNRGDTISISLKKDNSKYGMAMPEELSELLEMDAEGSEVFHKLTPGRQRNLIHIVAKFKNSETRITKAIIVLEYLKSVNGQLDFKELNLAFKNAKHL